MLCDVDSFVDIDCCASCFGGKFTDTFCCRRSEIDMLCDIDPDKSALVCSCVLASG